MRWISSLEDIIVVAALTTSKQTIIAVYALASVAVHMETILVGYLVMLHTLNQVERLYRKQNKMTKSGIIHSSF